MSGVEAEQDFQLSIKKEYLLEINWDFQFIIMVHSGHILGWSNEAILQPVLEKSASHIHIGALLYCFPCINLR